jgi:quinoprotein glucose dehydrogenase
VNQILYANTTYAVHLVKLIPRTEAEEFPIEPPTGVDFGPQIGAPFASMRVVALSKLGLLCNKPPWGTLVAVDLKAGKILWRSTVGTTEDRAPPGIAFKWGTPLVNGVVITAGGLVFTGAMDAYLRAFDAKSGEELWQGRLPISPLTDFDTKRRKRREFICGTGCRPVYANFLLFSAIQDASDPALVSTSILLPSGKFFRVFGKHIHEVVH